jgi:hypothetical protein
VRFGRHGELATLLRLGSAFGLADYSAGMRCFHFLTGFFFDAGFFAMYPPGYLVAKVNP